MTKKGKYIDRAALFNSLSGAKTVEEIFAAIQAAPAADVQEVVRCNDCKYRDAEKGFCEGRGWPMQLVPDDGFCDKGKRRDE